MRKSTFLLPAIFVVIVIALSAIFIVDEREKALVLQFGRVIDVKEDPGLAFKIPVIQEVVRYDDRILSREVGPLEVTPLDDRRLVVDAFARYRIIDTRQFRLAVGAGGIAVAGEAVRVEHRHGRIEVPRLDQGEEVVGRVDRPARGPDHEVRAAADEQQTAEHDAECDLPPGRLLARGLRWRRHARLLCVGLLIRRLWRWR